MDYKNIFAEVLYIISVYEKCRVPQGIWTRKYTKELKESIDVMHILVDLLSQEVVDVDDKIDFVSEFIKMNKNRIFPKENIDFKDAVNIALTRADYDAKRYSEINTLMKSILDECEMWLNTRGNKYKRKITYLLKALHNLPRVYFASEKGHIFDGVFFPASIEEALEYANLDIEIKNSFSRNTYIIQYF